MRSKACVQVFLEKEGDDHCVLQFTSYLVLLERSVLVCSFPRHVLSLLPFLLLVSASSCSFGAWTFCAVWTVAVRRVSEMAVYSHKRT